MLKKTITCIFSFFTLILFSQQTFDSLIEYISIENISPGKDEFSYDVLLMNNEKSFYFNYFSKFNNYEELLKNFQYNRSNRRLEYNLKSSQYFESRNLKRKYFCNDIPLKINWKISNERKKILGYNCISANGKFRGRQYTVWFTNEIPYRYGPWKLNGLPGVILEALDDSKEFHFIANRVSLNSSFYLPVELEKKFQEEKVKEIIGYSDFIKIENEFFMEIREQIKASYPKGTVFREDPPIRGSLLERSFEWEETNKP